jgi:hypothetical protein
MKRDALLTGTHTWGDARVQDLMTVSARGKKRNTKEDRKKEHAKFIGVARKPKPPSAKAARRDAKRPLSYSEAKPKKKPMSTAERCAVASARAREKAAERKQLIDDIDELKSSGRVRTVDENKMIMCAVQSRRLDALEADDKITPVPTTATRLACWS